MVFPLFFSEGLDNNPLSQVLEARVENLKGKTEESDVKEVTELESLIPDIKEKITDTNEMRAETLRKMREAVGFGLGSGWCFCLAGGTTNLNSGLIALVTYGKFSDHEQSRIFFGN